MPITRAYGQASQLGNTPAASNPVINGAFDIWQRGTSLTTIAIDADYTADRWYSYTTGATSGRTISRQATGDTTNLPFIEYCARIQRDSGNTSTAQWQFFNPFETTNAIPFAGRTVTLSFYARRGANFSSGSNVLRVILTTGTGTDQNPINGYTGGADVIDQNVTLTTTWQRFSLTASIGSSVKELAPNFLWIPSGTAGAADYYEITGVQIDIGSVALPFRRNSATLAGEFLACQRYFQRYVGGLGLPYPAYSSGTTLIFGAVQMPIKMRTAPSITVGGTIYFFNSSAEVSAASPTVDFSDMYEGGGRLRLGGFTGLTSGLLTMAYYNQGHISLSAEL